MGFMMIIYVYIYNTNYVLKGLRQPQKVTHVERKALDMLAKLKEKDNDNAGNLMERLIRNCARTLSIMLRNI